MYFYIWQKLAGERAGWQPLSVLWAGGDGSQAGRDYTAGSEYGAGGRTRGRGPASGSDTAIMFMRSIRRPVLYLRIFHIKTDIKRTIGFVRLSQLMNLTILAFCFDRL